MKNKTPQRSAEKCSEPQREWPSEIATRRTAFALQIVQIVAIFLAGSWAVYVWTKTVRGSTSTGIQVVGETAVAWSPTHEACKASFKVTFENIGTNIITLEPVAYTLVAVPSTRLLDSESMKVLNFVETSDVPVEGELRGMEGPIRPKEKRFKEIWFIFKPDRGKQYSVEVIVDDNKPEFLSRWHAEIESCDAPLTSQKATPTLHQQRTTAS